MAHLVEPKPVLPHIRFQRADKLPHPIARIFFYEHSYTVAGCPHRPASHATVDCHQYTCFLDHMGSTELPLHLVSIGWLGTPLALSLFSHCVIHSNLCIRIPRSDMQIPYYRISEISSDCFCSSDTLQIPYALFSAKYL